MDLVILLMWGRIWVALLIQSPQIHLHTFTHTHTQVFALRKYTLQKVGSVVVCIARCKGGHCRNGGIIFFSRCISVQFQPVPGSKGLVGSPSTPQVDFQAASSRGWRRGPSVLPRAHLLKLA